MQIYDTPIPAPDLIFKDGRYDHEATLEAEQKYLTDLRTAVLALGTSDIAGEIIRVPYADGCAQYMVAKVNGKHALVHMPLGDAWRDPAFERMASVKEIRLRVKEEARFQKAMQMARES